MEYKVGDSVVYYNPVHGGVAMAFTIVDIREDHYITDQGATIPVCLADQLCTPASKMEVLLYG